MCADLCRQHPLAASGEAASSRGVTSRRVRGSQGESRLQTSGGDAEDEHRQENKPSLLGMWRFILSSRVRHSTASPGNVVRGACAAEMLRNRDGRSRMRRRVDSLAGALMLTSVFKNTTRVEAFFSCRCVERVVTHRDAMIVNLSQQPPWNEDIHGWSCMAACHLLRLEETRAAVPCEMQEAMIRGEFFTVFVYYISHPAEPSAGCCAGGRLRDVTIGLSAEREGKGLHLICWVPVFKRSR